MLKNYYERFTPEQGYEKLLFRSGKGLQSAELNDMQAQMQHQVKGVADAILKDGDLTTDGDVLIDDKTGQVKLGECAIYLRGQIRNIALAELQIATNELLYLGVWLAEVVVSEIDDPSLRDPAIGAHNFDEPGAGRLKITCQWGLVGDDKVGNFYPVHRVDNGVLIAKQPPPQLDAVTVALARYDREANGGSYVVDGMDLTYRGIDESDQVFSLAEGKAHIEGFEVAFPTSLRKLFSADPDLQTVLDEPHRFSPDEQGNMRIDLSFTPVHSIQRVDATLEVTKTLTHGGFEGAKDPLPDQAVLEVVSITQNQTSYQQGIDFQLTQNQIDWSLNGIEPSPGTTYTIIYRYRDQLSVNADETGFTVSNLVSGSLVTVDYQWKMPRIDLVSLDSQGQVRRIKGVPNSYQPIAPKAPESQLILARISQNWSGTGMPEVKNMAVRSVPMSALGEMQQQIGDLYELLSIERLRNDANSQEPAAKLGVFVDPFNDDDMRDQGLTQNAAIIDGELLLPVDVAVNEIVLPNDNKALTLDYQVETILEQTMKTGVMKVNPYQAFEPVPALVTLQPAVDHWTTTSQVWTSPVTRRITRGGGAVRRTSWVQSTEVLSRSITAAEFLRSRSVNFELKGFGPNESLKEIIFDGVAVSAGEQS